MNADGSDPTQLTFDPTPHNQLPDWSPNGRKIVYEDGASPNGRIFVMNANGTDKRQLTQDPETTSVPHGRLTVAAAHLVALTHGPSFTEKHQAPIAGLHSLHPRSVASSSVDRARSLRGHRGQPRATVAQRGRFGGRLHRQRARRGRCLMGRPICAAAILAMLALVGCGSGKATTTAAASSSGQGVTSTAASTAPTAPTATDRRCASTVPRSLAPPSGQWPT